MAPLLHARISVRGPTARNMDRRNNGAVRATCVAALATLGTACAIRFYRRQYRRGRIISFTNYIAAYPARRRMRDVIRSLLPLWQSKYDFSSRATASPIIRFEPSDVIVFAPSKCGTTWVTHICHQIRTRGAEVDFDDHDDVVPWLERLGTRYLDGTRFNDDPADALLRHNMARPRVFKSHLNWEDRPGGGGGPYKQIWVFRNCVDMMASTSRFLPSLWGIRPAPSEEEMASFLLEEGDVEDALRSLSCAWEHRNDTSGGRMLLLFYENMLEDHRGTVERIAEFVLDGVDAPGLSPEELDRIVEQTTREGMLRHRAAFACRAQARNAHDARGLALDESVLVGKVTPGRSNAGAADVVRKGRSGSSRSDIESAVQRAWHSYEDMRCIHRS